MDKKNNPGTATHLADSPLKKRPLPAEIHVEPCGGVGEPVLHNVEKKQQASAMERVAGENPSSPDGKGAARKNRKLVLHKAGHDPRAAALVALWRVLEDGIDSQQALDDALSSPGLMPTDKRLCTELTYGTLRQYLRLEWFVRRNLDKPDKLPGEMYLCMIMAFYEMTHLRTPHHACVGWAVRHIKHRFGPGMGRVANGTLRTLQRSLRNFRDASFYQAQWDDPVDALACQYAMPRWITSLWLEAYGQERTLRLLAASQQAAPSGLRLNCAHPGWQQFIAALQQAAVPSVKEAKRAARHTADQGTHPG